MSEARRVLPDSKDAKARKVDAAREWSPLSMSAWVTRLLKLEAEEATGQNEAVVPQQTWCLKIEIALTGSETLKDESAHRYEAAASWPIAIFNSTNFKAPAMPKLEPSTELILDSVIVQLVIKHILLRSSSFASHLIVA